MTRKIGPRTSTDSPLPKPRTKPAKSSTSQVATRATVASRYTKRTRTGVTKLVKRKSKSAVKNPAPSRAGLGTRDMPEGPFEEPDGATGGGGGGGVPSAPLEALVEAPAGVL